MKHMKIAILNFSGNVGKTTVSAHLLQPRMNNCPVFSIESINSGLDADGITIEKMRGKNFGGLVQQLMVLDSAIVDVGASNVEDFMHMMQQFDESHEEFDFFLIPTVKEQKAQIDTVNTIIALAGLGIPPAKIRVVFNKIELDSNLVSDFKLIFSLQRAQGIFIADEKSTIYVNEVFEGLKTIGKSLAEITTDPRDYRQELRTATTDEVKQECLTMVALKRLGSTANKNLNAVFDGLFV